MAQKIVTTLSGQTIKIDEHGKWSYLQNPDLLTIDSTINTSNSTVEKNKQLYPNLNETQQKDLQYLEKVAKRREIEYVLVIDSLHRKIAEVDFSLSYAKLAKSKEEVQVYNNKKNGLSDQVKSIQKLYESNYKTIQQIEKAFLAKSSKIQNKINSLYEQMGLVREAGDKISKEIKVEKPSTASITTTDIISIQYNNKAALKSGPVLLFNFTHEKYRNYFKSDQLLQAYGTVIKQGKKYYLQLQVSIASKDAAKSYGEIQKGSLCKIILINGRHVNLSSLHTSTGSLEAYTARFVYTLDYELEKEEARLLTSYPIDSVGIMWSSGFENYLVYNVDVLQNQLMQLEKL